LMDAIRVRMSGDIDLSLYAGWYVCDYGALT
jgi:hypothetical protein